MIVPRGVMGLLTAKREDARDRCDVVGAAGARPECHRRRTTHQRAPFRSARCRRPCRLTTSVGALAYLMGGAGERRAMVGRVPAYLLGKTVVYAALGIAAILVRRELAVRLCPIIVVTRTVSGSVMLLLGYIQSISRSVRASPDGFRRGRAPILGRLHPGQGLRVLLLPDVRPPLLRADHPAGAPIRGRDDLPP